MNENPDNNFKTRHWIIRTYKTNPKVPFKINDIELFFDIVEAGRAKSDIPAITKVHFQNGAQKNIV